MGFMKPGDLLVQMLGHLTVDAVASKKADFVYYIENIGVKQVIFDLSCITGFDAAVVPVGTEWIRCLKKNNILSAYIVTTFGPAKMAATAIGFGVGVHFQVFKNMSEVDKLL